MSFEFVICTTVFVQCGNRVALGNAWSVEDHMVYYWHYYYRCAEAKQKIKFDIQMNEC